MNFGEALELLKTGSKISRANWNGKGMWIAYCANWNGSFDPASPQFQGRPFIYMRTASADIVPWVASQTDLLEADWEVVVDITSTSTAACSVTN